MPSIPGVTTYFPLKRVTQTVTNYNNRTETIVNTNDTVTGGFSYRMRASGVTPGFASGNRQTNAFRYVEQNVQYDTGSWRSDHAVPSPKVSEWTTQTGNALSVYPSLPQLTVAEITSLENQAKAKVLLKIKDQKINLGQAFAERGQTARLLGDTISRIARAYSALRSGSFVNAAKVLGVSLKSSNFRRRFRRNQQKAIARGWLELQYGWRPLISDIYGAAEEIQRHSKDRPTKCYASSKQSRTFSKNNTRVVNGNIIRFEGGEATYEVSCGCCYTVTNATLKTLSEIGMTNPALLAWELAPYSFVVDWVAPIGSWLSALDASLGLQFKYGFQTNYYKGNAWQRSIGDGKKTFVVGWNHYNMQTGWGQGSTEYVEVVRKSLGTFPIATMPFFKDPFSVEHVSNAIALLKSNSKR